MQANTLLDACLARGAVALMLACGASASSAAAPAAGFEPDLLTRSVQRSGSGSIGLVVATVPVGGSLASEQKALAQAQRLKRALVQQGVDPSLVFIEARPDREVGATAALRAGGS